MKTFLRRIICHDLVARGLVAPLRPLMRRWESSRETEFRAVLRRRLGPAPVVQSGPFSGLRYPGYLACGSALEPKLLGTYEQELHATIAGIPADWPRHIHDIGCAEGYYAVGLARRHPQAQVNAYDIDPDARQACAAMSELNQTTARLTISGTCAPATLLTIGPEERGLIISDCEGYERELFTPEVISNLHASIVIIELHAPFAEEAWTGQLASAFAPSHHVSIIPSLYEAERRASSVSDLVPGNDPQARKAAFAEYRVDWMTWLVALPRRDFPLPVSSNVQL